jgi:hypothetical protein
MIWAKDMVDVLMSFLPVCCSRRAAGTAARQTMARG